MIERIEEGIVNKKDAESWLGSGSRLAVLPDGKYICVYNGESGSGVNDFVPEVAYSDDGINWTEPKALFPEYIGKKSISVSVRNTDDGRVSIAGWSADIDYDGEMWWSDELSAMKRNQLVYTLSDDGYTFAPLSFIELPYYGAAEMPGGMQVDKDGSMYIVYSPYPAIEAEAESDTGCLVMLKSTDGGKSWEHSKIARVDGKSLYAETWIATLTDGAKMITTWQTASETTPDMYLYSKDGKDFGDVLPLPFKGQSTALTTLPDGRVIIAYNQRKESPIGVWVAVAKPDEFGFNMLSNECAWESKTKNRKGDSESGDFSEWTSFAFGEPHVIPTEDGSYLLVFWYSEGGYNGIKTLKFKIV